MALLSSLLRVPRRNHRARFPREWRFCAESRTARIASLTPKKGQAQEPVEDGNRLTKRLADDRHGHGGRGEGAKSYCLKGGGDIPHADVASQPPEQMEPGELERAGLILHIECQHLGQRHRESMACPENTPPVEEQPLDVLR